MKLCSLLVVSLLIGRSLNAEPPQIEPLPPAPPKAPTTIKTHEGRVVLELKDAALQATSIPLPHQELELQVSIEAVIYEVDPAKLSKLAGKTESPVNEHRRDWHSVGVGRPARIAGKHSEVRHPDGPAIDVVSCRSTISCCCVRPSAAG